MCITFGGNPQINFCHVFAVWTLSSLGLMHLDTGYLVNATPSTVFKLFGCFVKI